MKVKELYNLVNDGKIISDINLQRAIVYNTDKQAQVIDSLVNDIPLPAFYLWRREDGILEVLDGKQRIEAIKLFYQNMLQYNGKLWKEYADNPEFQDSLNDCKLTIIECSGTEEKKRQIFFRINTLGVPLSDFEVLNGLFNGLYIEELNDAYIQEKVYKKVLKDESVDRGKNKYFILRFIYRMRYGKYPITEQLHEYVANRQSDSFKADSNFIKPYFKFISDIFGSSSKISKALLFEFAARHLNERSIWLQNKDAIVKNTNEYINSSEYKQSQTKNQDIEDIILAACGGIQLDPVRLFSSDIRKQLLADAPKNEHGLVFCSECNQHHEAENMAVDHIEPWSKGGRTILSNARLICRFCNSKKGNR